MKKSGIQIKKSLLGGIGTIGNTLKNKGNFLKQKFTNIIKKKENQNNNQNGHQKQKSYNIQISEEDNVYDVNDEEDEYEEYEDIKDTNLTSNENIEENEDISTDKNLKIYTKENKQEIPLSDKIKDYSDDIICHYLFLKGTLISKDIIPVIKCIKIKSIKKKSILNRFGFGRKQNKINNQETKVNYLLFFDENFLYFLKDKEINQFEPSIRMIGNKYNICQLIDKTVEKVDNDNIKINLEFLIDEKKILKQMLFKKETGNEFIYILNQKLDSFNLKLNEN